MSDWKKIEAVLFASGSYISVDELARICNLSKKKTESALQDLKDHYEKIDSSLDVSNDDSTYKLTVKQDFSDLVQEVVSGVEMPKPIMETLALIAYKSPVLQSEIINTRGTSAYDHISFLEEKKFITRERYSRSYKVKVTEKFHDYFDVDDSKMQSLFEEIEKPEVPIEVELEKEEDFEEKITDRLKKQVPTETNSEREDFLDNFEKRLGDVTIRLDTAEEEIRKIAPREEVEKEDVDSAFEKED